MQTKTISEINEVYDLGIDKIVGAIKKGRVKKVLLQFPEGLKPYATVIADEIEAKSGCECFIWLGSCFGACDVPLEVSCLSVDLIVQFGHTNWSFKGF